MKVAKFLQEHKEDLLEKWITEMRATGDDRFVKMVPDELFFNASKEFIDIAVSNIVDTEEAFKMKVERFTEHAVRIGWPLTFLIDGLRNLKLLIFKLMEEKNKFDSQEVVELVTQIDNWVAPMNNRIVESYSDNWEKTVSLQKVALQELSAPLIPVFEKISVMPLVGTIDTERARLIMENLLSGVVKHRSEVVLIDITGVPVVDTMVAHHIIQAADAVRLVGSKCMLVGIRPEIAQTIVNLGIDLEQITTTSTLQKGIEKALAYTNREIVVLEEGAD